jgi:hypothetical protein
MALSAQSGSYTIKGKIGNYDAPAKVYLHYQFKDGFKTDSVTLKKGAYEFKGEVTDPIKAYLILNTQGTGIQNTRDGIDFYIEKGNLSISSPDSAIHIKVKGLSLIHI